MKPSRTPSSNAAEDERWAAWMTAAQDGDLESYERLLTELEQVLRGFLRRMLGGTELVDDCLQDCLFAIHRARHTYDPSRPFKPWAFTLARHKTIDVIRKRSTRRHHETTDGEMSTARAAASEHPEVALDVAHALQALDPPYREALRLTKLQGYTLEEAADRVGVSKAAMRSRVHRGMRKLRWVLERKLR